MSVLIPELGRKFRLLIEYGYAKDFDDLAGKIGRKHSTIIGWANDARGREPGTVPTAFADIVIQLLMEPLASGGTPAQARQVVFGSAQDFENHLRAGAAPSLTHFVRTEGDSRPCKLICRDCGDMGLIEIAGQRAADDDAYSVKTGQEFRIVIERDLRHLHCLALQNAQGLWLPLKTGLDGKTGHILVPHTDEQGAPLYMIERHDLGRNLFVVMVTPDPIPAEIIAARQDGTTLDASLLGRLAFHYKNQDAKRRMIFALRLVVEAA